MRKLDRTIFDVDDLSFFAFYGLGLRHTELELGINEATPGNKSRGDAISLANYGRNSTSNHSHTPSSSEIDCKRFQGHIENL